MNLKEETIQIVNSLPDTSTRDDIYKVIQLLYEDKNKKEEKIWKNKTGRAFFVLASMAAFVSFIILVYNLFEPPCVLSESKWQDIFLYGCWLIVPPIWFLYEYICIFPDEHKLNPIQRDDFKFTQELASKFWAALLVLFGIILVFKHDLRLH